MQVLARYVILIQYIRNRTIMFQERKIKIPKWPLIHRKTALSLVKAYFCRYWSWYGKNEISLIKKFSELHSAKYIITTVSGTCALESALTALGAGFAPPR